MNSPPTRQRASRRRPPRASLACETCRIRKTKCDQAKPCSYCAYHALDCVYRSVAKEGVSTGRSRHPHSKNAQRDTSRPSPWPKVDQNRQASRHERNEMLASGHGNLPNLSPGDMSRIPANSASMNPVGSEANSERANWGAAINDRHEPYDSASRDGVSGLNLHTNGTEFYGNSSNLAFLGNLYAGARNQANGRAPNNLGNELSPLNGGSQHTANTPGSTTNVHGQTTSPERPQPGEEPKSDRTQPSIVNLLYNPNYSPSPSGPQGEHQSHKGSTPRNNNLGESPRFTITDHRPGIGSAVERLSADAQLEIEKMFISSYFSNKHYIHPMLCKKGFMVRCEHEAWDFSWRPLFCRGHSKFAGLYFAVVAVGAINASPNETSLLDHYCTYTPDPRKPSGTGGYSPLDFADYYFGLAKQALGDVFESSSIESAQALLLMCAFCQDALRPHSCFMYSGMAVRTAIAIGLASGMSSLPTEIRKEGQRTWWCIYAHEIEMCVSSGRMDSMKDLHYYQALFPTLKATCNNLNNPEAEDNFAAMIPVMVTLAQIMSETSHLLYHNPNCSIHEMSQIAMAIDKKLLDWKANLPKFLNLDAASLNDPEWASKQKLVLKLRFYNARILIHRPFLVASTSTSTSSSSSSTIDGIYLQHIPICLVAARANIQMQYESFLHKLYVRTWWYNTTYALYATMILLHLLLSGSSTTSNAATTPTLDVPEDDLVKDVEKTLDIVTSMNNLLAARRCAELIREVLDVAKTCLARRRRIRGHSQSSFLPTADAAPTAISPSNTFRAEAGQNPATSTTIPISPFSISQPGPGSPGLGSDPAAAATAAAPVFGTGTGSGMSSADGDFFSSLFMGQDSEDGGAGDEARAGVLANLVDPGILEDFVFGGGNDVFRY